MYLSLATKAKECKQNKKLTSREKEYLSLAALGFRNLAISKILFVSYSTVKKTFEMISRKTEANNKTNAVAICFMHQILTQEDILSVFFKYEKRIIEVLKNEETH